MYRYMPTMYRYILWKLKENRIMYRYMIPHVSIHPFRKTPCIDTFYPMYRYTEEPNHIVPFLHSFNRYIPTRVLIHDQNFTPCIDTCNPMYWYIPRPRHWTTFNYFQSIHPLWSIDTQQDLNHVSIHHLHVSIHQDQKCEKTHRKTSKPPWMTPNTLEKTEWIQNIATHTKLNVKHRNLIK